MLESCWIVDEVVIMASSSKFWKDACMWNKPLADYWMEGNAGVSNPQVQWVDVPFCFYSVTQCLIREWRKMLSYPIGKEGGLQCCPVFLGLDGLRAEDVLEMEFSSPQEAGGFYNNYSQLKGFASRQGFREKKWLEKVDRKREHKHNHELAYGKLVDYLRSHRKISERGLQGGDVSAAIRYLEGLARMDGKMFWRYKLGAGQHLCNLFWSDSRCQDDYGIFGDVLAFDVTYGRNKYNLPVVVFSGVNHHNQTCVFGTAMVSCETHESYIWVLCQFLECMQGKAPQSVITDGDPAMRIAI
ncbi:hypothetical protein AHAS_Ahas02G0080700 [Arachis hypogaea]